MSVADEHDKFRYELGRVIRYSLWSHQDLLKKVFPQDDAIIKSVEALGERPQKVPGGLFKKWFIKLAPNVARETVTYKTDEMNTMIYFQESMKERLWQNHYFGIFFYLML